MASHTVKERNAFYEIDEDCMERQRQSGVKMREREEKSLQARSAEHVRKRYRNNETM